MCHFNHATLALWWAPGWGIISDSLLYGGSCVRTRMAAESSSQQLGEQPGWGTEGTQREDRYLRSELKSSTKMISWIKLAGVRFRTLEEQWAQKMSLQSAFLTYPCKSLSHHGGSCPPPRLGGGLSLSERGYPGLITPSTVTGYSFLSHMCI